MSGDVLEGARRTALDCSVSGQQNCLLSERPISLYYSMRSNQPDAINQKGPVVRLGLSGFIGSLNALRGAQGVQTGQRQTVGVVYFGLHCTTLRGVNREVLNTKTPLNERGSFVLGALMPFAELGPFNRQKAKLLAF